MSKKRIEDVICDVFIGDTQKNALDFIAFMRANEMPPPDEPEYENCWDIMLKNEVVCFVHLVSANENNTKALTIFSDQVPGTWITWSDNENNGEYIDVPVDEHIKKIAWENVKNCSEDCGGDCKPGRRKRVLGKEFDHLCASALLFENPDSEALECVKEMVLARKHDILKNV